MKSANRRAKKASATPRADGQRPLTARAVAELCGVELKTVHNWALDGRLAHFRTPGRHLRFQPEVVHAFLRECGYEVLHGEARLRVVCVVSRVSARLRKAVAHVDFTRVPDIWSALLEIGRSAPDVCLVDAREGLPEGLVQAANAIKRRFPRVEIAVISERALPGEGASLRYLGWDGLSRLLSR